MGDPGGIGGDCLLLCYHAYGKNFPLFYVIDDIQRLKKLADHLKLTINFTSIVSPKEVTRSLCLHSIPVFPLSLKHPYTIGELTPLHALCVIQSIEIAVMHIQEKLASSILTNPISKKTLFDIQFPFAGHTQFLMALAKKYFHIQTSRPSFMLLKNKYLAVVPLTDHIPIKDVSQNITAQLLTDCIHVIYEDCTKKLHIPSPRIAVSSLNPHAGEGGHIGNEEERVIAPTLKALQPLYPNLAGPFPADTLFTPPFLKRYDIFVTMTHDQALIPLKTLDFQNSINITLGLPFLRTSPAHGTAHTKSGTQKIHFLSFYEALKAASQE